jgi:hypothetical protein
MDRTLLKLGDMTYTYHFVVDEPYVRTTTKRYFQQQPFIRRPEGIVGVLGVVLIPSVAIVAFDGDRIVFVLWMAILYVLTAIGGGAAIRAFTYQSARYSTYFGETSTCHIDANGWCIDGSRRTFKSQWSERGSASCFPDGVLLLHKRIGGYGMTLSKWRTTMCWLPNDRLLDADPGGVVSFIETKTRVRHVA